MTIQEEIRAGVANIIADWFMPDGLSGQTMPNERSCIGDIWDYLDSQGVVIKVERELPNTEGCLEPSDYIAKVRMDGFDVLVVEPLIGEK